jgi:uncharacterized protein
MTRRSFSFPRFRTVRRGIESSSRIFRSDRARASLRFDWPRSHRLAQEHLPVDGASVTEESSRWSTLGERSEPDDGIRVLLRRAWCGGTAHPPGRLSQWGASEYCPRDYCLVGEDVQMRVLDGDQFLVRIFLGESDRFHHTPLARALLERLRREGFAGATVIHGVAGFGASSVVHTASLIELSSDLPVLIEVIDDEAHVEQTFADPR